MKMFVVRTFFSDLSSLFDWIGLSDGTNIHCCNEIYYIWIWFRGGRGYYWIYYWKFCVRLHARCDVLLLGYLILLTSMRCLPSIPALMFNEYTPTWRYSVRYTDNLTSSMWTVQYSKYPSALGQSECRKNITGTITYIKRKYHFHTVRRILYSYWTRGWSNKSTPKIC